MENYSTNLPTGKRKSLGMYYIGLFGCSCMFIQITKKQVDSFTPSREIPSCQLTAEWIGDSRPSRLIHKVTLEGAKEPSNFFRIVLGADPGTHSL